MRKIIIAQFVVLLLGTLFAWGNFAYELYNWLNARTCTLGCPTYFSPNPFLTPCFFGALFFATAFIFSAILLKKSKNNS
ncbi:MAG: hypothetical protein WC348_03125 [Patescibacteria group bacterium]|jgi:TRAP-type C4-dicarboxylate transport system permease small subunit